MKEAYFYIEVIDGVVVATYCSDREVSYDNFERVPVEWIASKVGVLRSNYTEYGLPTAEYKLVLEQEAEKKRLEKEEADRVIAEQKEADRKVVFEQNQKEIERLESVNFLLSKALHERPAELSQVLSNIQSRSYLGLPVNQDDLIEIERFYGRDSRKEPVSRKKKGA